MNEWIRRSIQLARGQDYLDKLAEVYPVKPGEQRAIDRGTWNEVEVAYRARDARKLVEALLKLERFPIKDPYVAYLRRDAGARDRNPATLARIADRLFTMSLEELYDASVEPKEVNTQIGPMFVNWLKRTDHIFLPESEFVRSPGPAFLDGSGKVLKGFANRVLGCALDKEPDFIAKVGSTYVVGEAKFLTDEGGHQKAQFNDAMTLVKGAGGTARRVAILDGVVWIEKTSGMHRQITGQDADIMSALLLDEYLEELGA